LVCQDLVESPKKAQHGFSRMTRSRTGNVKDNSQGEMRGVPFDFAQGRLLHYAADDETVRCFGRDDELGCEAYLALGCEAAP
jgi:hypothetical protein